MKFKLGQRVKWISQSRGTMLGKEGVIVHVVPPNTCVLASCPIRKDDTLLCRALGTDWHTLFSSRIGSTSRRSHESYLVAVKIGKTDRAKQALYWPRIGGLELCDNELSLGYVCIGTYKTAVRCQRCDEEINTIYIGLGRGFKPFGPFCGECARGRE